MDRIVDNFRNVLETAVSVDDFNTRVQEVLEMSREIVSRRDDRRATVQRRVSERLRVFILMGSMIPQTDDVQTPMFVYYIRESRGDNHVAAAQEGADLFRDMTDTIYVMIMHVSEDLVGDVYSVLSEVGYPSCAAVHAITGDVLASGCNIVIEENLVQDFVDKVYTRLNPVKLEEMELSTHGSTGASSASVDDKLDELSRLLGRDLTSMRSERDLRKFLMSTGGVLVPTARQLKKAIDSLGLVVDGVTGKRAYVDTIINWIMQE